MISVCTKKRIVYLFLYLTLCCSLKAEDHQGIETHVDDEQQILISDNFDMHENIVLSDQMVDAHTRSMLQQNQKLVRNIIVKNNRLVSQESILVRLPFKPGKAFKPNQSSQAIKNIFSLGYFRNVQLYVDVIDDEQVDLCIVVTEKPRVTDVIIKGMKHLSEKDLKKETGLDKIQTMNEEELKNFAAKIKRYYGKKNYHFAHVETRLEVVDEQHVIAHFDVKEGQKTYVHRIAFKGNKSVTSKKLKRIIYTREVWPLSPMDSSGSYQADMIEADKAMIEDGYKSSGFVHAKVTDADVVFNEITNGYDVTYTINEGVMYFVKEINIQGNDILSSEVLKASIPIQPGQRYSVEKLRTSIEKLRLLWGEYGYIFADIEPSIDINEDDKTVDISFSFDLKDKVYLNRLSIRGNKKARDKIIRRQILIDEGDLVTNKKMDQSKDRVKLMGYFDEREGVNWKVTRIDDTHADLDLMLKEVKTGKFNCQISYGGVAKGGTTPTKGLVGSAVIGDRNLWGSGIATSLLAEVAERQQSITGSLMNPWLFDKPIRGNLNVYARHSEYTEGISYTINPPQEVVIGGFFGAGYIAKLFGESILETQIGFETITFDPKVEAAQRLTNAEKKYYQIVLDKTFQSGDQYWARWSISQDLRNGLVFTTNGYQWNWYGQLAFPLTETGFNFFKTELDATWYTPLIGENALVLCLHGHIGFIKPLNGRNAPWKSLFHIGGPGTIRGYTWGQIGPTWHGDSMGATKAFYVNAEFIVPLTPDLTTRAVMFYDGGAGWDMPYKNEIVALINASSTMNGPAFGDTLVNNEFFYRHSFGVGIRMLNPTPLQVDFGIKLNPSKVFKNKLTEVHLSMTHEF